MASFGRKGMKWIAIALALLALTLALVTPKASGFQVNAEEIKTEPPREVADNKAEIDFDEDDEPMMPGGKVEILTDENFERITQVSTGATTGDWFIKFYAPWCGHCKKMEPTWDELAKKTGGEVNVGKVDVTQNKALGKRFGIKGFPTLLMFSHGSVYKYGLARKLEPLMAYAKGGFKNASALPVPSPPSLSGGARNVFSTVLKDVQGIKNGKMPTPITLVVMSTALLLAMIILISFAPSSRGPSKRPEASRPKVD